MRYGAKEAQSGGIDFFAEFSFSPYEKKFIRTNELLFITRLIGSFQAFLHLFSAKKSINVYFGAMLNVYSADLS